MSIAITTITLTIQSTRGEPLSIFGSHLLVVVCFIAHLRIILLSIDKVIEDRSRMHEVPVDILVEEDLVEVLFSSLAVC